MNLPLPAPDGPSSPPPADVWLRMGEAVWSALSAAGAAVAQGVGVIDVDLPRELVTLPLMAMTAVGPRRSAVEPLPDDGHRPIVFVHGLAGHPGNFRPLAIYLRRQGRRRLYSVGLPSGGGAASQASYLSGYVDEVLAVNGLPEGQVDIVAHSRGGVVSRLALDDADTARRVANLVTIGTPHRGTVAARYGRATELDELRPESAVVARLHAQLPWTGPRLHCLWSASDPFVVPAAHAQVPGANNIELRGLGHCQLLLWPAGWRATHGALTENEKMTQESVQSLADLGLPPIDPAQAIAAGINEEQAALQRDVEENLRRELQARAADRAQKNEERDAARERAATERRVEAGKKAAARAATNEARAQRARERAEAKKAADVKKAEVAAEKAEAKEAADALKAAEKAEAKKAADAKKAEVAAKKAEAKKAADAKKAEAMAKKAEAKTAADALKAAESAEAKDPADGEDVEGGSEPDPDAEPTPDPKWRRRKDARPEELITAALQLFAEQGFARTNLRDVGKKAGVSKATVYLYFKNKEDLLLAAVQKSVVPILDFGDDYEIDSDAPAAEMIRTLVHRWVDEFEARSAAGLPRLVAAEASQFPELGQLYVDAVLQRARRLFQRILKRGVRAGEFKPIDVRDVVHVLLAPVLQAQIHKASLGTHDPSFPDVHVFLDLHVDLFLAAIQK